MFIAAAAIIGVGILLVVLQPGPPKGECVSQGAANSGLVDNESGCAISKESFNEIRDYETSPKLFRIAGLVIVVAGIGTGATAAIRRKPQAPETSFG